MYCDRSFQSTWQKLLVCGLLTATLVLVSATSTPAQSRQYRPPQGGSAPTSSGIGGSRGGSCTGESTLTFTALAPHSHVGQSTATYPTFSWYVPERQSFAVDFQLYVYDTDGSLQREPIYQTELSSTPGVMAFTLPETESELIVGQRYYWQAALICDPNHASEDAIVGAEIQIVESKVPNSERWYDLLKAAIDNTSAQPQSTPDLLLELAESERSASEDLASVAEANPNTDSDLLERSQNVLQQSDNLRQIAGAES